MPVDGVEKCPTKIDETLDCTRLMENNRKLNERTILTTIGYNSFIQKFKVNIETNADLTQSKISFHCFVVWSRLKKKKKALRSNHTITPPFPHS